MERGKKISLQPEIVEQFQAQIKLDSKFFKRNNINDYSLMIAFVKYKTVDSQCLGKDQNIFKTYKGGVFSKKEGYFYVMSIIDILTAFETRKNI